MQAGQKLFGNQQLLLSHRTCKCRGIFLRVRQGAVPSQAFQENHDYKPGGESQAIRRDGVTLGVFVSTTLQREPSPAADFQRAQGTGSEQAANTLLLRTREQDLVAAQHLPSGG